METTLPLDDIYCQCSVSVSVSATTKQLGRRVEKLGMKDTESRTRAAIHISKHVKSFITRDD